MFRSAFGSTAVLVLVIVACGTDADRPARAPGSGSQEQVLHAAVCDGLPVEALLDDLDEQVTGQRGRDARVRNPEIRAATGLGTHGLLAKRIAAALARGESRPRALAGLEPDRAAATLAAALLHIEGRFGVDCRYLERFEARRPRTRREVAQRVLESHGLGRALAPAALTDALVEGGTLMDHAIDTPIAQLLVAFAAAQAARSTLEYRGAEDRSARLNLLVALLGEPPVVAGLVDAAGGTVGDDEKAVVLEVPAGAVTKIQPRLSWREVRDSRHHGPRQHGLGNRPGHD